MKYLTLLMGISLCLCATAQPDTLKPETQIKSVSVFFKGAQVNRHCELSLNKGKHIIVVAQLPAEIDPSSIQVASVAGCTTLSVKHRMQSVEPDRNDGKQKALEEAVDQHKQRIAHLAEEISVLQMEEKLLLDNSDIMGSTSNYQVSTMVETAAFYRKRINEIRLAKLAINKKIEDEKTALTNDLSRLNQHISKQLIQYSEILIALESPQTIKSELAVSYCVKSAGWSPSYDFRVQDVDKPLKIVYNALVFQSTGEDWNKVNLTLSNGNPALGGEKPALMPVIFGSRSVEYNRNADLGSGTLQGRLTDTQTGEALPFVNVLLMQGDHAIAGTATDFDGHYIFRPVSSGNYTISASYVGYQSVQERIAVVADRITFKNIGMTGSVSLSAFEVVEYSVPLIDRDGGTSGATLSGRNPDGMRASTVSSMRLHADEIQRMPTGGVPAARIQGMSARGSRSEMADFDPEDLIDHHVVQNVGHLEYNIDIPYTIRSDGQDNSIQIKETQIPAQYQYQVVPKLESDAFLVAKIVNHAELNLLSGDASIYYGGTFTGRAFVDAARTDDTLALSLGRDKALVVQRTLNRVLNDRRMQGNSVKETIGWDLVLRNNKSQKISVILEDQYPLSQIKSVQVNLQHASNAVVDPKTGTLTWTFDMEPNSRKEITFAYEVKYPGEYAGMIK